MIRFVIYLNFILNSSYCYLIALQDVQSSITFPLEITFQQFQVNTFFAYGIWSKYAPLSGFGEVGIFNSNCFKIHNVVDAQTNEVYFLYYDCIDQSKNAITKIIRFIDNTGIIQKFEIVIENTQYEFQWFYFQIKQWPVQKKLDLCVVDGKAYLIHEILEIEYPFNSNNVLIIFGGDLILQGVQLLDTQNQVTFSPFPGIVYIYPIDIRETYIENDPLQAIFDSFSSLYICNCQQNQENSISVEFNQFDLFEYNSNNRYCDQYTINGWIKIIDIYQINEFFTFLFLKMCANSENTKIINQNLCAFQLFYYISKDIYKIRVTTYSYDIPQINQDFTNNQNLISYEFEIHEIKSWISLQIIVEQKFTKQVNHYHLVQFKFKFGNILQLKQDFMTIKIYNFKFNNCQGYFIDNFCDKSCKTCDGPTKNNCLSCDITQNRVYLKEKKACICPYGYIDNQSCLNYQNYNFEINSNILDSRKNCEYGYFEIDDNCIKCPSVFQKNKITCLECVNNPQNWMQDPYCKSYMVLDDKGSPFQLLDEEQIYYYLFDGENLNLCENCTSNNILDNYGNYILKFINFKHFCQYTSSERSRLQFSESECYKCSSIQYCMKCQITTNGLYCLQCIPLATLTDGYCVSIQQIIVQKQQQCQSPYYVTSNYGCILCSIKNCIYCFEYLSNDLMFSTLYNDFTAFEKDEYHSIGCALCIPKYIFDFKKVECIQQKSSIENCSRSFINLNGIEVCTLSSIQDFTIAPEIEFCQSKIPKCQQCIQTPKQQIQCIICEDGYSASILTGMCELCKIQHAKICIEGNSFKFDAWVQQIQSFMMKFLPNQYFYLTPFYSFLISQYPISCQEGYKTIIEGICILDCDSNCQKCEQTKPQIYVSICEYCGKNYYDQPIRSSENGVCFTCSQLCEICSPRLQEEIKNINPFFIVTKENLIFTHKCLKPVNQYQFLQEFSLNQILEKNVQTSITIDPYVFISKYCFENNCASYLNFNIEIAESNFYDVLLPYLWDNYEHQINYFYCNQMGIEKLKININLYQLSKPVEDWQINPISIQNIIKQKIFSLKELLISMHGKQKDAIIIYNSLALVNFDGIQFTGLNFQSIYNRFILSFINQKNYLTFLEFRDVSFFGLQEEQFFQINTTELKIKEYRSFNLRIVNMIIKDSIIIFLNADTIQINSMEINNCTFYNVTLFKFINFSNIQINSFNIINSTFQNSNIFDINRLQLSRSTLSIDQIKIQNNYFINSSFFQDFGDFQSQQGTIFIFNQFLSHNKFINTQLFKVNKNLTIFNLNLDVNEFINSTLFQTFNTQSGKNLLFIFQNIFGFQNNFSNSILILSIDDQRLRLNIKNFNLTESKSPINQQEFLFQIKCFSINVQDFFMIENFNIIVFNLLQTLEASFNNIIFRNSNQFNKIYFSFDCYPFADYSSKFLVIIGFMHLELQNIQLIKQFNFDTSLILILSDIIFNQDDNETIKIKNILVQNCILLKKNLGNLFSLLVIFSEKYQSIYLSNLVFNENTFHQYTDDLSQSSAGLIYIGSLQSQIVIETILCDSNHITNSTHSFITIQSLTVLIQDFTIKNLNYFDDPAWDQIYFIQNDILDQVDLFNLIGSIFKIENIGAFSIATQNFTLINGIFSNISAQSSAVLDIKTQGNGVVVLKQIHFENISADLSQIVDLNGCINIYSKNSLLNLEFTSLVFNQVFNNLGSSILSIIPSQKKNIIMFNNIKLKNCFSFLNSLTKIEFPENKQIINLVKIRNLLITNTLNGVINFFFQLKNYEMSDINKIRTDNAILNLKNCQFWLENTVVQGIFIQPILQLSDISQMILHQVKFISIQQPYGFNLIQISQQKSKIQSSFFYKFTIQNTTSIALRDNISFNQILRKFNLPQNQCHSNFTVLSQGNYNQSFILSQIDQLNQNQTTTFSLFQFYSDSDWVKIIIQEFSLILNNCKNNQQNGIQIVLKKFKRLKVNELKCFQNNFFLNGCISLQNSNTLLEQKPEIIIQFSYFQANKGGSGVGIFSSNLNLKLLNCNIFQNNSTKFGGGIYFDSQGEEIKVINTIILNNLAQIGGGIYFNGNNHITNKNFIKSILQFNFAINNANNIKEYPRSLSLSINNKEMNFEKLERNNQPIQQLLIKPYKILQQGKIITTTFLLFPSGQQIQEYQVFNFHKQKFIQYFSEISFSFKNSYGEQIIESSNIICSLQQNIISNSTINKIAYFANLYIENATEKISLKSFQFKFDPFSPQNTYSQFQIKCVTQNNSNQLIYLINSKSLLCQLGEFYVDEACQICESNQGYYSVNYNVTKCSIFDKNKFKTITSNRIELLPGFWRPNLLSDQTEICFKSMQVCKGGWGTGDLLCSFGHIGGLCEECDIYNIKGEGFHFRNQYDYQCNFCYEFYSSIFPFFLTLLWSFLSIILTLRSVEKSNKLYTSLRLRQKYYKILFPLNQDHESILLKMLINYVWIFSAVLTFNINFQISFNITSSTANPIQFMTTSLDCYLMNIFSISIIYSKLIFMIILVFVEIFVITNIYFLITQIRKKKFDESIISTTAIYLYVSNHASLIKRQKLNQNSFCSLLTRRQISGIDYIQGDVSYIFDTANHSKWILGFIQPGLGVFGFLIPSILFLLIFIQRKKLDQIKRRKYICYLFNEYNQNSYFWEQIKIWEKTIIIVILTYFETENSLKVSLLGTCLLFYQKLAAKFQPYHIKILNQIDIDSGQICIFALFLASFTSQSDQESIELQYTLQILLMILFIQLCIPFLYAAFRVYYKKYKITIISRTIKILQKIRIKLLFLNQKLNKWEDQENQLRNNIQKLRHCLTQISKVSIESQKYQTSQITSRNISQRNKFLNMVYYSQNIF